MTGSVKAFLREDAWFELGAQLEVSMGVFYLLYLGWCEHEGLTALSGDAFYAELPPAGLFRVGNYVHGLKCTERAERIVAAAVAILEQDDDGPLRDWL